MNLHFPLNRYRVYLNITKKSVLIKLFTSRTINRVLRMSWFLFEPNGNRKFSNLKYNPPQNNQEPPPVQITIQKRILQETILTKVLISVFHYKLYS